MKVADLIVLLAPLSERDITYWQGDQSMDFERGSLLVVNENTVALNVPTAPPVEPPAPTLDSALYLLADWVRNAELRIKALEETGSGIDYDTLSCHVDHGELARHLSEVISASDVAEHISASDVAENIDLEGVADHISASDIADYIDASDVAENMNLTEEVQEVLRHARLIVS